MCPKNVYSYLWLTLLKVETVKSFYFPIAGFLFLLVCLISTCYFSVYDETVEREHRGGYLAFTVKVVILYNFDTFYSENILGIIVFCIISY